MILYKYKEVFVQMNKVKEKTKEVSKAEINNNVGNNKTKIARNYLLIIICLGLLLITLVIMYVFLNEPKFKNLTIEIGTTLPQKKDFINSKRIIENDVQILTDMSNIDINKVGCYDIEILYKDKKKIVKINLVDTTKPEVTFQDVFKNINYEINPNDFIKEMKDMSELTVKAENIPEINKYGEYPITIIVEDASGNSTRGECKLIINWLREQFTLELGDKLKKSDLVDISTDEDKIDDKYIETINNSPIGEYEINVELEGQPYICKVKVQDTKAPTLTLRDITVYKEQNIAVTKESFIENVEDASGEVVTTLNSEINTNNIGTYKIEIKAIDKNGNEVVKTANLIVKKDDVGPTISGLYDIYTDKHKGIDYKQGVHAVDEIDGTVEFAVDDSSVNINRAGTYYAKYTARDLKGNTTTRSRKIIVNHDEEDTTQKFNEFYNTNLAGKDIRGIVSTIRNKIDYNTNWGGDDPIWYGLSNKVGNCYVHALLVERALNKQGISNKIIYTEDKTHYWNLVLEGGVWRHYDSTPGAHIIGPATDVEKYESSCMRHRNWDRTKWPEAN